MDFAKLGIHNISIPIGLRFGLSDGLFPTPNREQLIYSSKAKETILNKLKLVADYMVEKYNENSIDCKDVHEIFNYYAGSNRNITIGKTIIDASKLSIYSDIQFKKPEYSTYKLTDFANLYKVKDYIFYEYKVGMEYSRGQFRQATGYYNTTLNYVQAKETGKIWTYDETLAGNKKSYIKSLLPPNDYNAIKFLRKSKKFHLRNKDKQHAYDNFIALLQLHKYPRNTWRDRIKEFQSIVKELTKDFKDVDSTSIPQAWLDARKKKRVTTANGGNRRVKLQGEINCRLTSELQRYVHGKNSKLVPTVLKVEHLASSPLLNVYGKQSDELVFDVLYGAATKQKMKFYVLSEREHKVAQTLDIHNFISIEKFMEGKNKPFKRLVTAYLINELITKYADTFAKTTLLETISKKLRKDLEDLKVYHKANYEGYCDEQVYKAMVEVAFDKNLFDETIFTEYKAIKELLDTFPFIETTLEVLPTYSINEGNQHYLDILIYQFKYHKIRIDYTNYKLTLNEDISLGKPTTEETIEELTQNA